MILLSVTERSRSVRGVPCIARGGVADDSKPK